MFARLMGLKVIKPYELQQLMHKQAVTILDVNARHSWLDARVPGVVGGYLVEANLWSTPMNRV